MVTLQQLEARLDNLQRAFEQAMRNQIPLTEKTDYASASVEPMNNRMTEEEERQVKARSDIDYIAIMTEIDLDE